MVRNMVTENIKKKHLLSWKIRNEIPELFAHALLRDIIKQIDGCYNKCVTVHMMFPVIKFLYNDYNYDKLIINYFTKMFMK